MARAILGLLLASGFIHAQTCSPPADAPVIVRSELEEVHKNLKSGPFYRELSRRFGKPLACRMEAKEKDRSVTYEFRDHARLVGNANYSLELNEVRMESRLAEKSAMALLKQAEKHSYRPAGCSIQWKQPEEDKSETGARERVYRGKACNCQGRLVFENKDVIRLVLKSAC